MTNYATKLQRQKAVNCNLSFIIYYDSWTSKFRSKAKSKFNFLNDNTYSATKEITKFLQLSEHRMSKKINKGKNN